jgi:hypothetical protein
MNYNLVYFVLTVLLSVIAFFLVRFFYLMDEIRKDVKQVLISNASRDAMIQEFKTDIQEIRRTVHDHGRKLNTLEIEISKQSNKKNNGPQY